MFGLPGWVAAWLVFYCSAIIGSWILYYSGVLLGENKKKGEK